jgi:hypothetical protein
MENPLSLHGLLNLLKDNDDIRPYLDQKNLKVLDIPCGIPSFLFGLFHDFNFETLVGVDIKSEAGIIEDCYKGKENSYPRATNLHELYKADISFNGKELPGKRDYLNELDFKKHFCFHWQTKISEFLSNSTDTFDAIIVSNFLHLMRSKEEMSALLIVLAGRLEIGGLLYVKVNHSENENAINACHQKISDSEFSNLFINFFTVYLNQCFFKEEDRKPISKIFLGKRLAR